MMAKATKPAVAKKSEPFAVPHGLRSEEDVKIKFLVPFLASKGYKSECIDFNTPIEVQEGRKQKTIFADAVIYTTGAKTTPIIVCETKPPTEPLTNNDKEQAISYARLLDKIAPLVVLTNGDQTRVYQSLSKNRVPELPARKDLKDDFVKFVVSAEVREALRTEAKHELFIIDDVQSFKSILRACHDAIRNDIGHDATIAFDELSKVLFCKMHEEREHPDTSNRFRTAVFDHGIKTLGVNVVKQIWDETKSDPRFSGLFKPDSVINLEDRTIRKIVSLFENYDLSLTAFDVKGEAFEYFLGETFTGGLGQYFTPRNVVEFMVDAIDPKIGQKMVDPFCGTGGFLIYAFEVVSQKIRLQEFSEEEKAKWKLELSSRCLYGTDWAERTTLACKMNMIVHGDGSAGIVLHHGLTDVPGIVEEGRFDLCITNPPFGSIENAPEILKRYELGAGRKSQDRVILAAERALKLIKPGGHVAIVVIDGMLNNDSAGYARKYLRDNSFVQAIISLPAVTFEGYHARAKTSILFLEKKAQADESGKQRPVFMSVVENTGYAANGEAVPGNELPEVLLDLKAFLRGAESHVHKNSWIAELGDRMDAEYYWNRVAIAAPTEKELNLAAASVAEQLKMVSDELQDVKAKVHNTFADLETIPLPLSALLESVEDRVKVDRETSYKLLGVKWWGLGSFLREEKLGKSISAKYLNKISAGWIIYNRLFAFRGSFALVPLEQNGCFASGEFPTFKVREDVREPELISLYVVHCLNSPQYLIEVDRASTGSTKTSRNRYKEERFLTMRVAIPKSIKRMRDLVDLLNKSQSLKVRQEEMKARLDAMSISVSRMIPVGFSMTEESNTKQVEVLANRKEPLPAILSGMDETPKKTKKRKAKTKKDV